MTEPRVTIDRALHDELREPECDIFVFALQVDPDQLERAEAAVDEVLRRFHEENEQRYETFRGAWTWTRANDLILLDILDCVDPVVVVEELAADLSALGISGSLERQPATGVAPLPNGAYMIEARLHVGEATTEEGEKLGWRTDTEAWERVLRIAVDWCTDGGRLRDVAFRKSFLDPFLLPRGEDPVSRLMDEREDNPQLWTNEGAETRWVATGRQESRVSLITLLPVDDPDPAWRRAYGGMKDAVRAAAEEIAYAFVKHGHGGQDSGLGGTLMSWPPRPGWDFRETSVITVTLQNNHLAPDAFALQALGPGYDLRGLSFPSYKAEAIGHTTLLEHRDLEAWFRSPFVPFGTSPADLPSLRVPKVLADARVELNPILLQEENLVRRNHAFHLDPEGLP